MSKCEYVPAQGEQLSSVYKRKLEYNGFDLKYWTDKSHFKYSLMLQSVYYAKNGVFKNENFREAIDYPKDNLLVFDSGGFQIASFKKKGEVCNLDPLDSLRWQEKNCDVAMNLDIPPNLDGKPSYKDFVDALDESVKNFQLFQDKRKNYNMRLLNVLHGENLELMNLWYDKVKHFKFDGWAIGMKPPFDPMIQALGFMFLYEKGEFKKDTCKHIHFFGTSGKHVCPTLVYCAKQINQRCTYDSSSYNIGSIYRTYYLPFEIGPSLSFGEKYKEINPNIKQLPCMCPVCRSVKNINDLNTVDIYAGTLISLHNMYQYIYYNNMLNTLVDDKEKYLDYIKTINISEKTLKSIEFIDDAMKMGVNLAVCKYRDWLPSQEVNKTKQKTIWC